MKAIKTEVSDWLPGKLMYIFEIVLVIVCIDIFYE
jgi:hypothetical protein